MKSKILLIAAPDTTITQLKDHKKRLAIIFRVYKIKRNKKWIKYLIKDMPKRIKTLKDLESFTLDMISKAF